MILLDRPKRIANLAAAVRAAACFGAHQVAYTGERIKFLDRLPRELRNPRYEVDWYHEDWLVLDKSLVPVAVEFDREFQDLTSFNHPGNSIYIFGPEDGRISPGLLRQCHEFVTIPTFHCMNLAAAVNVVLYDRMLKELPLWRTEP